MQRLSSFPPGLTLCVTLAAAVLVAEQGRTQEEGRGEARQQSAAQETGTSGEASSGTSDDNNEQMTDEMVRQRSQDREAIMAIGDAFSRAYQNGDADVAASRFTVDAEYVDEFGNPVIGRDAIREMLAAYFAEHPECNLQIRVDSIRFVGPDVALEDGRAIMRHQEEPHPVESRFTAVHVRQNGEWKTVSVRDYAPGDRHEHARQLRSLDWLVGDWVDEGDDAIVNFSCRKSRNGNFLLREFQIIIQGQDTMSGTQRIGWDPLARRLRTWVFDSEGAFGEGYWYQDQQRWLLKCAGVTADGETVSCTTIYTPLSRDVMTWQSVDLEIGGVLQPDSEVYTIVRRAPQPTSAENASAQPQYGTRPVVR